MSGSLRNFLGGVIAAILGAVLFQNCSGSVNHASSAPTTSMASAGGNGFDGMAYIQAMTTGTCSDGTVIFAKIILTSPTTASLVRDNCQDINPPIALTASQFQLSSGPPSTLTYNSRIFIAVDLQSQWQVSPFNVNSIYFTSAGANGTTGQVGIGTSNPSSIFEIVTSAPQAMSRSVMATYYSSDTGPYWGGWYEARASRGAMGAPSAIQAGDILGGYGFSGNDGTGFFPGSTLGGMVSVATENWNSGSYGSNLIFFSTANGTANAAARMTIDQSGHIGIGSSSPVATLDINGVARLSANASAPSSCNGVINGTIALTSRSTICVCNGGISAWVSANDGATACSW